MTEFQKQIDSDEDKTPRGAVKFLALSASALIPQLKNPGRQRGAALAIKRALEQVEDELSRLYAIERTARLLATDCASFEKQNAASPSEVEEHKAALDALNEAIAVQVPK